MHIIEELILFPEPQPVQHIELDPQRVNHNSIITSLTVFNAETSSNTFITTSYTFVMIILVCVDNPINFQVIEMWKS